MVFDDTTRLVPASLVRSLTGRHGEEIVEMAEGQSLFGEFNWVWNVALGGRPERRFWLTEIIAPELAQNQTTAQVIAHILGQKKLFRSSEVGQLMLIGDPHLFALCRANELRGEIVRRTRWITRASLEKFLTDRLILK